MTKYKGKKIENYSEVEYFLFSNSEAQPDVSLNLMCVLSIVLILRISSTGVLLD